MHAASDSASELWSFTSTKQIGTHAGPPVRGSANVVRSIERTKGICIYQVNQVGWWMQVLYHALQTSIS